MPDSVGRAHTFRLLDRFLQHQLRVAGAMVSIWVDAAMLPGGELSSRGDRSVPPRGYRYFYILLVPRRALSNLLHVS